MISSSALQHAIVALATASLAYLLSSHSEAIDFLRNANTSILWPPSRTSAPALSCIVLSFAVFTVLIFMRNSTSEEQQRVRAHKRKLILAQLTQAMRWSEDDEEATDADDADGKNEKKEKKEKKPPEIKELFEMLYDDVEERHVTEFGVAASDASYVGVLELFKSRLAPALEEATRFTALANGLPPPSGLDAAATGTDDLKRLTLYQDGSKLRDLLELYEKHIRKGFGALVPKLIVRAAWATRHATDREQRNSGLRTLIALIQPHVQLYAVSALLMAFDSSMGAATWHSVASLLDGIDAGTMSVEELREVFLQTFATLGLCVFSHLTSCAFTERVAGRFSNALKGEVLRGILRKDTVFFDVYPCGVIQERLNHDASDLSSKCFHLPMRILHLVLLIVSNSYAIYRMRPELLWLCIAPIPLIALMQKLFITKMERLHRRGRRVSERVVANTNEIIKELRTVRSFAMEAEEAETYAASSQYRTHIEETTSVIHHCLFLAPLVLMFIGTRLAATYLGGLYVADKLITVGMAVQIGNAADHLQHCMRSLVDLLPELFKVFGPVGRICDAISSVPSIEPHPGMAPKLGAVAALAPALDGRIDFVDVDFTFPSEPQKQILHGLSFRAMPGEKVAFVGPTGCGKSTAIQLIQRFYAHDSGQVLLDGRPIEQYDVHFLRRKISVVAQDNVLFSTTVRENVTYGLPRDVRDALTDAEVEAACRKANAWDFVQGFPRKLETYCGERGVKLSGGQKQRLAIARAIIRKPTICLLDEATSALDSKSEAAVQRALDQMIDENASGCTIMIAHRLSTVRNCDRIFVMDRGAVAESGTHEELLEIEIEKERGGGDEAKTVRGLYHDLWNVQMGSSDDAKGELDELRAELALARAQLAKKAARAESEASTLVRVDSAAGISTTSSECDAEDA